MLDLVQAAVGEVKQVLGKHPIEIRVPEEITVRLDADRIKEVLVQLLENAAKYSPPESPIRITAELKGANLEVSVADQGAGIDDMEQVLIFDKFYRGKNQRYRVQGTGMGLAIARAIVEAHGGKIGVTSQLGMRFGVLFSFAGAAVGRRLCARRARSRRIGAVAEQRQRGDVVVGGGSLHEILRRLENRQAQVLCA